MPVKKSKNKKLEKYDLKNIVQNPDSYKSLIYGIVTVVVLFIVLFLGLRSLSKNQAKITENAVSTLQNERVHTVISGETLWSIAEKEYGDGFKWEVIAKANNISEAQVLEAGTKLNIPGANLDISKANIEALKLSPTISPNITLKPEVSPTIVPSAKEKVDSDQKIAGSSYTVVKGDTLWDIAIRAYGDGFRWTEIARDNNLKNPDLIHPGNVFKLRRL